MRLLPMDQLYGMVDLNTNLSGGADAFKSEQISDDIVSPDIVIDEDLFTTEGNLSIENVLCWDAGEWHFNTTTAPELTGNEDDLQTIVQGITLDNTVAVSNAPTSDVITEHTIPGGAEASTESRFVRRVTHLHQSNEENAAGEINIAMKPDIVQMPARQRVHVSNAIGWFDIGEALTSAHYHHWGDSKATGATPRWQVGIKARRMECDFLELQFDRQTLLGILNAVNQIF